MASSCGEGKVAALFTEGVSSSAEEEMAIDETASMVTLAQMLVLCTKCLTVRKSKECAQDFLDHLSGKESAVCHFVFGRRS